MLQPEGVHIRLHWVGGNGRDPEGRGDFQNRDQPFVRQAMPVYFNISYSQHGILTSM